MSHNTFGHLFRVTTFGESHGVALGCVVDGCPPGIALAAGLHCSRLDGSEIVYNNRHPYMPDFVICRSEIREEMLGALRQIW